MAHSACRWNAGYALCR